MHTLCSSPGTAKAAEQAGKGHATGMSATITTPLPKVMMNGSAAVIPTGWPWIAGCTIMYLYNSHDVLVAVLAAFPMHTLCLVTLGSLYKMLVMCSIIFLYDVSSLAACAGPVAPASMLAWCVNCVRLHAVGMHGTCSMQHAHLLILCKPGK